MNKNSLVTTVLRWVKATVITVSLGSVGAVHIQPNVLSPHKKKAASPFGLDALTRAAALGVIFA